MSILRYCLIQRMVDFSTLSLLLLVFLRPVTLFLPHDPNALFHLLTVFFVVSVFFCTNLSAQHSFPTLPRFPLSKSLNSPQHTANIRVSATLDSHQSLIHELSSRPRALNHPLAPRPFNQTTNCLPTSGLNPSSLNSLPACGSCLPDQVQPSNLFQSPKLPPEFPDNRVPPATVRASATRVSQPLAPIPKFTNAAASLDIQN